jgi:hypothetical protein
MNAYELFDSLAPRLGPRLYEIWHRRDLCILATRITVEVGRYFGIEVHPVGVRVIVANQPWIERRIKGDDPDEIVKDPACHAVGLGHPLGGTEGGPGIAGHMVAVADGWMGDFSIAQAERLDRRIVTGPAIVTPFSGERKWRVLNRTYVLYELIDVPNYKTAPDWCEPTRRKPIVAELIRELRSAKSA